MPVPPPSSKQILRFFVIPTLLFASAELSTSQELNVPLHTQMLTRHGTSAPLRELALQVPVSVAKGKKAKPIERLPLPTGNLLTPSQRDVAEQSAVLPSVLTTAGKNFDGAGQGFVGPNGTFVVDSLPSDANLAVGTTQVVQWVNTSFVIFDKASGKALLGPVPGNAVFHRLPNKCSTTNDGDPIVVFDKRASRWVLTQLAITNSSGQLASPFLQCIAVSTSADATGTYNLYSLSFTSLNDYPKLAVWADAYYMSFNMFDPKSFAFQGSRACALQRSRMLLGQSAAAICTVPLGSSIGGLLPSDLEGLTLPPSGTPNFFVNYGVNALNLWKFHVNFSTPSSSTFTGPVRVAVASFTPACSGGACIPQPSTTQKLDSLADRLMYRLSYRNTGTVQSLLVNQSVKSSVSRSGIRWYEIRNPAATPVVFQQGTYSPSSTARWMGSLAMDRFGDIAVGYSAASSSVFPSVRYTGRVATDPLGTMESEKTVLSGTGAQLPSSVCPASNCAFRWGDYTAMSLDPVDDCTFWYTNQYLKSSGSFNWHTRIASFYFPSRQSKSNAPGLTIAASPTTLSQARGSSITVELMIRASGGFNGNVTIIATGLPSGVTTTPTTPFTIATNGQSVTNLTLKVSVSSSAVVGTYPFKISATSGSLSSSVSALLQVH